MKLANRVVCSVMLVACGSNDPAERPPVNLETVKAALAAYQDCLRGGKPGELTESLAIALAEAGSEGLGCATNVRAPLAEALELPAPVALAHLDDIKAVCTDLATIERAVNGLASKAGAPGITESACRPAQIAVAFVQPPPEMRDMFPKLYISSNALVAYADQQRPGDDRRHTVFARMTDATWDVREAPAQTHEWAWTDDGLLVVTWQDKADKGRRAVYLDDGKGGWSAGGKIVLDGVESIWRIKDSVSVLGFEKGRSDTTVVQRSRDAGTTFARPVRLFEGEESDHVNIVADEDGAIVSLVGSREGPTKLDGYRMAVELAKPTSTAHFTAPDDGKISTLMKVCRADAVYWAIHRQKVVQSRDAGRNWTEVATLEAAPEYPYLACSDAALMMWVDRDNNQRSVRLCHATGCGAPVVVPLEHITHVGLHPSPEPEVWLAREAGSGPFLVTAHRLDATGLVLQRAMIATTESTHDGAIRDGKTFVILRRTD